jgi:hypothetical protein
VTYAIHDTVHGAALALARDLAADGHGIVVFAPGNATQYDVAVLLSGERDPVGTLVAVNGFGCYRFGSIIDLHPSYVSEKLNVQPGDAEVLAELLDATGTEVRRLTLGQLVD